MEHIDIEIVNRQDDLIIKIKYDNVIVLSFNYNLETHELELASRTMDDSKERSIIRLYTYDGSDINVYKHILNYHIDEVINKHEKILNDLYYVNNAYADKIDDILNYKTNDYILITPKLINKTKYEIVTTYKIKT